MNDEEKGVKGFTFWSSYYEQYKKIPNKRDKLLFINCILSYVFDGELEEITKNPIVDVAFTGIKSNLDNSIKKARNGAIKKYKEKSKQNQNEIKMKSNVKLKEEEKEEGKEKEEEKGEGEETANYGKFANVALTHTQYNTLYSHDHLDYIDKLSVYKESTGKTYNSDFATIMKWLVEDKKKQYKDYYTYEVIEDVEDEEEKERLLEEMERLRGGNHG